MRRLLAVTLAGAAALSLILTIGAAYGAFDPPPPNPAIKAGVIGPAGWQVTRRYSYNRVLVIEGECHNRERAREIAAFIVEPVTEAYDEVLIYVRQRGAVSPTTRVQWRKQTGYRLLEF